VLYTVGHGTLSGDEFVTLLRDAGIAAAVDVRRVPKSRHNPQFTRETLEQRLAAAGADYRWEPLLGGWRSALGASPDQALRNRSFRNFAGYMRSPEFREAVARLVSGAGREPTAILCAESVWWRCHRRLIADHVSLVEGMRVLHLMHDGRLEPHRPTDGARVEGDDLFFDAGQLSSGVELAGP
jgi:uncharacterized protein (DUF488 family)